MYNQLKLADFKQAVKNGMKVLHLDCESSPALVYTHYIGSKVSINHGQIKKESQIICVQYKWEGDKKAKYMQWDKLGKAEWDDSSMLNETARLISEADIILGQNIDNFDMKLLNGRLAQFNLDSIDNDNTIDILKLSRKSFRLLSQRLDYRSKKYGGKGKDKMDFQDWIDVTEGLVPVSKKMAPYGCKDVEDAQQIFYKEFEYYKQLPTKILKIINSYLYPKEIKTVRKCDRCNNCMKKNGTRKNKQRYSCTVCSRTIHILL